MKPSRVRRRGRTIGAAAIVTIVTSFTAVCSVEIILQAWTPTAAAATTPCRPGVTALIDAVRRARNAAAEVSGGEGQALSVYRRALEPEWSTVSAIGRECLGDAEAERALDAVDRLRYAEERAIRYEALDLEKRRREVDDLQKRLASSR